MESGGFKDNDPEGGGGGEVPPSSSTTSADRGGGARLNIKNKLNLVFYILNTVVTYGIGALGLFGRFPTNGELSAKYQTLVTPTGFTFAIWGVIFVFQGIFTIVQLTKKYRAAPLVQGGVSWFYIGTCTSQIAWTFVFASEIIVLSAIVMILILLSLLAVLYSQANLPRGNESLADYWLLRFPFEIHAGWIIAASLVNINVVLVYQQAASTLQLVGAGVALVLVAAVASFSLFYPSRPKWVIPIVLAWATAGIVFELMDPQESIEEFFGQNTIRDFLNSAAAVCILVVALIAVRLLCCCNCCPKRGGSSSRSAEEGAYLRSDDNGKYT